MVPTRHDGDKDSVDERLKTKLRRELGPILLRELENTATEDLMLNPDGSLWVKRLKERSTYLGQFPASQAMALIATIASAWKVVVTEDNPFLECKVPLDGSRFLGMVPPVVEAPSFAIRKRASIIFTLEEYIVSGVLSEKHKDIIKTAIKQRKNILVVGSTGAGKTTFINAVFDSLAKQTPGDRVVIIEDTPELQCKVKNYVSMLVTGKTTMLDCLRAAMRLRPTRIVVGEVRDGAALTMLKAWNTGHPGGMASVHADDAALGLLRLEMLVAEATPGVPQQRFIAEVVNVVVFITEDDSLPAGRKVKEVCWVRGYEGGKYVVEHV